MDTNNQKPPEESDELEQSPDSGEEAKPASPAQTAPASADAKKNAKQMSAGGFNPKQLLFANKFLFAFILLFLAAVGGMFFVLSSSKKSEPTVIKTTSLSTSELSALKGNTTLVGDSQTVLDVQSSAVFEGAVLLKKDLEVAGSLKVSSPLSLSSVTVSGNSALGQAALSGNLSVNGSSSLKGDVNLQGALSVAGKASFSSASASTLTVNTLQLTGDIAIPRHISFTGGIPSKADGSALGPGGTTSISGTDSAGTINMNTSGTTSAGTLVSVSFTQKFNKTPHVVVSPIGSGAAGLAFYATRTTSGFTIATATAPPVDSSFSFDYIVVE